ncbi:TOM1-like protein 1 [Heterodontus francisci]|uniref:TOM1-like protein 1 n=1 Tax=Heterodontus francisci TaxID=7792 RepID=UPI00355C8132
MAFGKAAKDPFSSRTGKLIEKATMGTLKTADWGQFNHICDIINSTEEGPKDAVKALKKRIAGNWNLMEIRLALSFIDSGMRNCGPSFQSLIVRKDFVKDVLAKILKPKYHPPIDIQNHILRFIQSWATTYRGPVDVSDVQVLYMEMKRKGLIFPTHNVGSTDTWKNDTVVALQPDNSKSTPVSKTPVSSAASLTPRPRNNITLVPEQVAKLYSELDMVTLNISVMSAILIENVPGSENPEDMEMLQKLQQTCRSMQERIMVLLLKVENEEVISRLIQANDTLNSTFLQYERFERRRATFRRMEDKAAASRKDSVMEPSAPCSANDLIDFTCSAPTPALQLPECVSQFSSLSLENGMSVSGQMGLCTANTFLQNRALPDIPLPDAVPTHVPGRETQSQVTDSLSEPLYANVVPPQSVLTLSPVHSLLSGPFNTPHPAAHTGTNQASASKSVGAELISLEFDPFSSSDYNTEAIYEDLDVALNKARTHHYRTAE